MKFIKILIALVVLAVPLGLRAAEGDPFITGKQMNGSLNISHASAGQIKFPSSSNASANANTYDNYTEGAIGIDITNGITLSGGSGLVFSNGYYRITGSVVTITLTMNNPGGTMASTDGVSYIKLAGIPNSTMRGRVAIYNDNSGGHTGNGSVAGDAFGIRLPGFAATGGPLVISGTYLIR